MRFSSTGLVVDDPVPPPPVPAFVDAVLRGVGQVMLQNNSYTGLMFLLGVFYSSVLLGAAVLVGAVVSTATALVLGLQRSQVLAGWYGFNGALTAAALLVFFQADTRAWMYVLCAAAVSTVLMATLLRLLAKWQLPALTAPFVFTTLCVVLASTPLGLLPGAANLPAPGRVPAVVHVERLVSWGTVGEGILNGVAQVFFLGHWLTGAIFTLALLVSSRIAAGSVLLGSLAGLLAGWAMGAAEPALRAGAYGFNAVLTAIVLCDVVLVMSASAAAYALLAVVATAMVYVWALAAFEPLGLPTLTLPFVVVSWVFILFCPKAWRLRQASGC